MPFSLSEEQKQNLAWLIVGILLLALLVALGPMLSPFVAAGIIGYALNPGVDWIASRRIGPLRIPRFVGVTIMVLLLILAGLALVLIVVPLVLRQIPLLQAQVPPLLDKLNAFLSPRLHQLGIDVRLDLAGIKALLTQQISTSGDELWSSVLASAKVGGTALLAWLANLLFVPMVLFYLLQDWHPFLKRLQFMIPRRWAGRVNTMATEVDSLLGQYLRGQLLVMLVLAVYYSVALTAAGFDSALPVGVLTGLLVFIPYVGFGLGLVLALIAAVLQFTGLYGLVAVAIIYGIGQVLESFILTPKLVGERIGLHPLVVIFALLAFGQLFGFVGVLLALPASAIVSVVVRHLRQHYLSSSFYNSET
ncbi:AI-2E family transporter [Herbaspirillum huttiense]|uniref:AI-2E family transporter n=1 Tax=Herbaspirillum huttiense TaxID=863372 RepID=UPI000421631C|nr:AI-2E family transporter [Herbaspirillum huttiense]